MMIDLYEPCMSEKGLRMQLRSAGAVTMLGGCGAGASRDREPVGQRVEASAGFVHGDDLACSGRRRWRCWWWRMMGRGSPRRWSGTDVRAAGEGARIERAWVGAGVCAGGGAGAWGHGDGGESGGGGARLVLRCRVRRSWTSSGEARWLRQGQGSAGSLVIARVGFRCCVGSEVATVGLMVGIVMSRLGGRRRWWWGLLERRIGEPGYARGGTAVALVAGERRFGALSVWATSRGWWAADDEASCGGAATRDEEVRGIDEAVNKVGGGFAGRGVRTRERGFPAQVSRGGGRRWCGWWRFRRCRPRGRRCRAPWTSGGWRGSRSLGLWC